MPRTNFRLDVLDELHTRLCFLVFLVSGSSAEQAMTISQAREVMVYVEHNIRAQSVLERG